MIILIGSIFARVMRALMKIQAFVVLVMAGILVACSPAELSTQPVPFLLPAASATPIRSSIPSPTLTQSSSTASTLAPPGTPTRTLRPPIPTRTLTPTPELLSCAGPEQPQADSPQPLQILYVNDHRLWQWDEAGQQVTEVKLPPGAVAPHISMDGRFAAYLVEGQAYDTPETPLPEIPLWLFDRQSGRARQVASFPTSEARRQYPESPHIYLDVRWLEGNLGLPEDHWLLVEVYPEPWAEMGCCLPGGDLYLVNAEMGEFHRILDATSYHFYSVRPDGRQIAALDLDGRLYLVDVPPAGQPEPLSVRLPANPWLVGPPVYSPDGAYVAFQVEGGLAVVDAQGTGIQELALENPCEGCYWGPRLPVTWQPDGRAFFTTTSLDDHFDPRAETTLVQVRLEPELKAETVAVIHANPFTFHFSPNGSHLSFWNQPDWDAIDAGEAQMNWVSLSLMDLHDLRPSRYAAEFGLRLKGWSPGGQRFLYTYSPTGGPNLDRRMLSLGDVCASPRELPVPAGSIIQETLWFDANRFLAWTLPAEGIPDRYTSGLYLYGLDAENPPVHIDDVVIDESEPYGSQRQLVVLSY